MISWQLSYVLRTRKQEKIFFLKRFIIQTQFNLHYTVDNLRVPCPNQEFISNPALCITLLTCEHDY
jgi:hypothetical protein